MVGKYKILLGDDSFVYEKVFTSRLRQEGYSVVVTPSDGVVIFDTIKRECPDVVIADYRLPHIDIIGLMSYFKKAMITPPIFIVTNSYDSNTMRTEAFNYGADDYLVKPFSLDILCASIQNLISINRPQQALLSSPDLSLFVLKKLQEIGCVSKGKGYFAIHYAIVQVVQDQNELELITKNLYCKIAKECNTTPRGVERAIRHHIEKIWMVGNRSVLEEYFGEGKPLTLPAKRPSNSNFIATVASRIRLELEQQRLQIG